MPYLDPVIRKEKAAEYRQRNRAILAEKERARGAAKRSAMNDQERAEYNAHKTAKVRTQKAAGLFDRTNSRRLAREQHERLKHDPEYRQRATARAKRWTQENRDRANATWKAIRLRRMETDINYRIANALRRRFYMAIKGNHNGGSAVRDLGCSVEHLRAYIEAQFQSGMSWDNWSRSGWHIDHKNPLKSFDLSDIEQARAACHYTNLQPLWAIDNIRKHCR